MLDHIVEFAPIPRITKPSAAKHRKGPDAEVAQIFKDSEPFSAYCFRTIADPFAGRINVLKIFSGKVRHRRDGLQLDSRFMSERLGALHVIQGKQLDKVTEATRRRHHRRA